MIKVAIVGCGKIADKHAWVIGRMKGARILAVCDREELMARQLQERFGIKYWFSDVNSLLDKIRPDVVHVTTPPQSHYEIGKMCLEAGAHLFMEKPFTMTALEADALLDLAKEKGLKVTVGHTMQYSPAAIRMRDLIKRGGLGGPVVHMESVYCYNLTDERYAKAVLGDRQHWVRALPGKLLHNIISHGLAKIAEFLSTDHPAVTSVGFCSRFLRDIGENDIVDELRVIIRDGDTTAYFTFSSQMGPGLHQFRIYGPRTGLIVDEDHQTVIKVCSTGYKSYLNFFIPPGIYARQYLGNLSENLMRFMRRDFHNDSGMTELTQLFYRSIAYGERLPIRYEEILVTARIMDLIFDQLK